MYYTSKQLDSFNANLHQKAFLQYYHLFRYKKQAFHSLCPHEKEFFFSMLELSSDEIGMIDIYGIQEAYEYIFYSIIVAYKNHVIDFENSKEKLLPQHVQRNINKDISFFCFYYRIWINQVDIYRDKYIHEVSDCITKRIKDIQRKRLTQEEYAIQEKMCYVLFFFVYYKAKMFFEEFGKNHILFTVKNYTFVATIFTFCHILSRHYFPCFNGDTNVTFNEDNLFENSKDLLGSIKELVVSYFNLLLSDKSAK